MALAGWAQTMFDFEQKFAICELFNRIDGIAQELTVDAGEAGLLGTVECSPDFLEALVNFVGEFPGGVAGFFLKVIKTLSDLLTGFRSFIGGEGYADGDAGEKA
jgi:hypothetical protein